MKQNSKRRVWFVYVLPISFSGQWGASELIIQNLKKKGWDCPCIPFPALNRTITNPFLRHLHYLGRLLGSWLRFCFLVFVKKPVVYVNLGQSLESFLRMGIPYIIFSLLRADRKIVISLHGSVFLSWKAKQIENRILRVFLRYTTFVTVLSARQKKRLYELGVPQEKIIIVPNTCEINALNPEQVFDKQCEIDEQNKKPIQILHLSLLLESKGYPQVLEAFEILSQRQLSRPVKGIICGPMSFSAFCTRFTNEKTKSHWINSKIHNINQSEQVSAEWINGATGKKKEKLFRESEIFIFPSRFPVEAQPLVLLEAMASGCAIVTTDEGEIPSTLNDQTAIFLEDTNPEHIANVIEELLGDTEKRVSLAQACIRLFNDKFSAERYAETWGDIFKTLSA